ncbi:hypothetical protein GCM10011321_15250 [Youhaiella tibetensis]|nr:hypothetical protein GCM10011321_15250 [Youhaiella tibetensis]
MLALDLAATQVLGVELIERIFQGLAADIHLIESLHGGKARSPALVGRAFAVFAAFGRLRHES